MDEIEEIEEIEETEEMQEVRNTEVKVGVIQTVENAQGKNCDEAARNLFYPVRPWISVHEYRKAEEHFKEELAKQDLIGNKVNEAVEEMVSVKMRNGVRGKSIEDDDQIGNSNGEGETQSMQAIDGTGRPAGLHNSTDRSTPSTGRSQAISTDRPVASHFYRPAGLPVPSMMQADNSDKATSSEDNDDSKDHTILQITNFPNHSTKKT